MNTVKTEMNTTNVQAVVNRITHYLKHSSLSSSTVDLNGDILSIHFQGDDYVVPTNEQLMHIRNIVFWDPSIRLLYAGNLIQYNTYTQIMTIKMNHYNMASNFFAKMKSFGVHVTTFELDNDSFCFEYTVGGRYHFNYDELEELQAIIDPEIKNHDSIRVVRFDDTYTIRVTVNRNK